MEPIERALMRARSERGQPARSAPLPRSGAPAVPVRHAFTRTRVVVPNEQLLLNRRVIANRVTHPVSDVYRSLRAQVLQRLAKEGGTTLGITSVGPREGKTLTAVNLAIAISMDVNQTVLLVDADLRNPGVKWHLGFDPEFGLDDYLIEGVPLADCLVNPGLDRLVVLPVKRPVLEATEFLSCPQMAALAAELKHRYPDRIILYDLPPLLTRGDAIGFLPQVDATLLVVRDGAVRADDLRRAADLLRDHNLIGTVLNAAA